MLIHKVSDRELLDYENKNIIVYCREVVETSQQNVHCIQTRK